MTKPNSLRAWWPNRIWKLRSGLWGPTHMRRVGWDFQWGYHRHSHTRWMFSLYVFTRSWTLALVRRRWPRPAKPSLGQGVLCVVGILGLQFFLNWMDAAPIDDLLMALVLLLGGLAVWVAYRITNR